MLAAQDAAARCKELGITALHVRIRATGGMLISLIVQLHGLMLLRQRYQDSWTRCAVCSPCPCTSRYAHWANRGCHTHSFRLDQTERRSPWSPAVKRDLQSWHLYDRCLDITILRSIAACIRWQATINKHWGFSLRLTKKLRGIFKMTDVCLIDACCR